MYIDRRSLRFGACPPSVRCALCVHRPSTEQNTKTQILTKIHHKASPAASPSAFRPSDPAPTSRPPPPVRSRRWTYPSSRVPIAPHRAARHRPRRAKSRPLRPPRSERNTSSVRTKRKRSHAAQPGNVPQGEAQEGDAVGGVREGAAAVREGVVAAVDDARLAPSQVLDRRVLFFSGGRTRASRPVVFVAPRARRKANKRQGRERERRRERGGNE